jgi:enoyl-CoA hydratase
MGHLIIEQEGSVAVVKVNRPDVLNALSQAVLVELEDFLGDVASTGSIRAIILTGEGHKSFIAGADIREMQGLSLLEMLSFSHLGQRVASALEDGPFLTIAAINGFALGGGLEMALACDIIYASDSARFGFPEVTLGLIPGFGGTQRLSRSVGLHRAKEMILTGKSITSQQAFQMGLINRLCPADTLLEEALATAKLVSEYPETAIRQAKRAIVIGASLSITEALELESNMFSVCGGDPESAALLEAFINKSHHKKP